MLSAVASDVAQFLANHLKDISITKRKIVKLGTDYLKPDCKLYPKLYEMLPRNAKQEAYKLFADHGVDFPTDEFGRELIGAFKRILVPGEGALMDMADIHFNDTIRTPVSELKLILNLSNRNDSFIYDEREDLVHKIHYEIIKDRMTYLLGDNFPRWLETNTIDCFLSYKPFGTRLYKEDDKQATYFNTWVDAEWCEGWIPEPGTPCPPEVETFLQAFTKDEASATSLKAWLRDCCFTRAEPILVLCGLPGVGKNIFTENIAGGLVGLSNYHSASRGFSESKFHAGVTNCRLFFLDELHLTPQTREVLKAYHNGLTTVERKGKDVGDPEKIHASFVIANNHAQKIKLEFTDRKFYVPELSDVPLTGSLGSDAIEKLILCLKDKDYLKRLASYLYTNFADQQAARFPKNEFFKSLCLNSYGPWFRRFIHECKVARIVESRVFNKGNRHPVDAFTLRDEIDHYTANFKEPLADLQILKEGRWTAASLVYQGEAQKEEETLLA